MRFSLIVPVYGVEKYLDECVSSLLSQTYTDFEIILVDDRSPDGCPAMCDALADKDDRIRVIHKSQNEGLGFARNTGLSAALGDYVLFVDSDDTISENCLAECNKVLDDAPDIAVWGMTMRYEDDAGNTVREDVIKPESFYSDCDEKKGKMFKMLSEHRVFQYACNKAYSREFLEKCDKKFEQTKLIEDFLFNIDIFKAARTVRSLDASFYYYRKPTHQTLASKYSPEFFELAKRKFLLEKSFLEYIGMYKGDCRDRVFENHIKHFVSAILRNASTSANLTKKEQNTLISEMICDETVQYVISEFEPRDKKIKIIMALMKRKKAAVLRVFCTSADRILHKLIHR